ncbi:hypothetical protein AMECASPLE_023419 [Ameca splendens]|uniref:Uncharacterized protein n=1 Tax=Ameca splendens TaxID=208324 RepID=A0ABV0YSE0_9TELE
MLLFLMLLYRLTCKGPDLNGSVIIPAEPSDYKKGQHKGFTKRQFNFLEGEEMSPGRKKMIPSVCPVVNLIRFGLQNRIWLFYCGNLGTHTHALTNTLWVV